ncbi:MAG: signal recognition particle protein [Nanoarchaeota archaeon]|jgi:signal recognition particle subunit SRP54|nr:signal recognition particle protein [Nanoarchaeota archaeon]|tara:strand:+ start:6054 stop:7397 length:1344 start_codon:yes stop_codon:yes gene_type:complete
MVLDNLSNSLKSTLKKVTSALFVDEKLVNELTQEIQRSLLQADVNVQLVFDLTNNIKTRFKEEKPTKEAPKREFLVKIVYEELTNLLGKDKEEIKITPKKPFKIMLVGLFGSGKTTTIGKLANYYKKRNQKVATLGLDVHRPAARDQLKQISDQVGVQCFIDEQEKNPLKIYKKFQDQYKNYDILLIDTAGRDALLQELIDEIESLNKEIQPDERLLVIPAELGQTTEKQATQFHKSCNITGIIVTKMDGTAKAGGALSAAAISGAKIKFLTVGEKPSDLETFNPPNFVSRLLGMGDLEALLEKASEAISEEKSKDLEKKLLEGDFNLIDLYEQMQAMSKMGSLSKIMELVPGMSQLKLPKDLLNVQEDKLKRWRFALDSFTKKELENPDIIDSSRLSRASKGSGVPASEVRDLLKQYKMAKKMMSTMKGKDPQKLMSKFKGKIPGM